MPESRDRCDRLLARVRVATFATFAAGLVTLLAAPVRAAEPVRHDAASVHAEVDRVLSDPRFQRARPDGTLIPTEHEAPSEPFKMPDFRPHDFEPSSASGVSEVLLWVLLGVFGVALVAVLTREGVRFARGRARKAKKKKAQGGGADGLDVATMALDRLPATLSRARKLAAEGHFEEAVHVLLGGALGYLHALANFSLEPAYTSREVLTRAPLTSETRRAFGELVMTVEVSLFGGLSVDAGDFGRCEESFVTLHRRLGGAA